MTITTTETIRRLPIQGGEPRRGDPSALWAVQAVANGDVSGGDNEAAFQFNPSGQRSGTMYSLEQFDVALDSGIAQVFELVLQIFAYDLGIQNHLHYELQGIAGTGRVAPSPADLGAIKGIFLGQQLGSIGSSFIFVRVPNVNTVAMRISAAGYVWDPLARRAPGGLRRFGGPWPI